MIDKFQQYYVRSHFQITKKYAFRIGSWNVIFSKLPGRKIVQKRFPFKDFAGYAWFSICTEQLRSAKVKPLSMIQI